MLVLCASAHLIHRPRPCGSRSFSASQNISSCASFLAIWMRLMTWIKGLQNILSRGREAKKSQPRFSFTIYAFKFLLFASIVLAQKISALKMTKKHDKTPIFRIDVAAAGDCEPYVIQEIGSSPGISSTRNVLINCCCGYRQLMEKSCSNCRIIFSQRSPLLASNRLSLLNRSLFAEAWCWWIPFARKINRLSVPAYSIKFDGWSITPSRISMPVTEGPDFIPYPRTLEP